MNKEQIKSILTTAETLHGWKVAMFPLSFIDSDGTITTIENVAQEMGLQVTEQAEDESFIYLNVLN